MINKYNDLIQSHTAIIELPKNIIYYDKKGKGHIFDPITKTGGLSKRDKEFSIILKHNKNNEISIKDKGYNERKIKYEMSKHVINNKKELKHIEPPIEKLHIPPKKENENISESYGDNYDKIEFFRNYLDINESSKNDIAMKGEGDLYKIVDKLYDELSKHISYDEIKKFQKKLNYKGLEYIRQWLDKKTEAGHTAEYTDFVRLVVYPQLLKYNENADKFKLMVVANDIANDPVLNVYGKYSKIEPSPNKYRVINSFLHAKPSGVYPKLKSISNNMNKFLNEYIKMRYNSVKGK